jgi:hypothetical protein
VPGSEYHPPNTLAGARTGALALAMSARTQEGQA